VRNGTKAFVSIVSLGAIAAGYQAGLAAEVSNGFSAPAPVVDQPAAASPAATSAATPVDPATSTPSPVDAAATPAAPGKTAAPAPVSTPKATSAAPAPAPNTSGTTHDGSAVRYQYGTVQVSVTKSGGKITAVNMLQEGATGGRQAAFTYLADLAVQANGSSFGNLSGATYTTDAFKQSLESALAKF
jgi:uncharacterized protein with FMN-binding domain